MSKINYTRNTTLTFGVVYNNANDVPGETVMFTVKSVQFDDSATDATAILQKDASITDGAANFTINPTDIADTIAPGKFFYDVKVLDTSGAIYMIDSGQFTLTAWPTNRES